MKHIVRATQETTKGHRHGHGVSFTIRCCADHEESHHIQNAALFTPEELLRRRRELMEQTARNHHAHLISLQTMVQAEKEQPEHEIEL